MIPLILNDSHFVEVLERNNLINDKMVILEKLQEEIEGVDNSVYQDINLYYYSVNERNENKTFHFYFAVIPHIQNKVTGNPKNAIIGLEFYDLIVLL